MPYGITELRAVGIGRESSYGAVGTITHWVPAKTANFINAIPREEVVEITQIIHNRLIYGRFK